jgi:hypothetical protein
MTLPLGLAGLWALCALTRALLPRPGWRGAAAVALIALGIPLLGWITLEKGPVWGLAVLAAGAMMLRRPPLRLRPPLPGVAVARGGSD